MKSNEIKNKSPSVVLKIFLKIYPNISIMFKDQDKMLKKLLF